jgi:hypothetical protein
MFKTTLTLALATLTAACSTGTPEAVSIPSATDACPSGFVRGDAELERYTDCTRVAGDLVVEGVTSLQPLAELRQVDGALRIHRTERLYSLAGLEKLVNLQEISLRKNSALINAAGLNGVAQVFSVTITENPRLTKSFGLLKGLRMQPSRVTITANAGLDAEGMHVANNPELARR